MSQYFNIKYSSDPQIILKQIKHKKFSMLKINKIPTVSKALDLISESWFISEVVELAYLCVIKFKVNENFDSNLKSDFIEKIQKRRFYIGKTIVMVFVAKSYKYHCKFFWKISGKEPFYTVDVDKGSDKVVKKYVLGFLIKEIKNGKIGILPSSQAKTDILLPDIGNAEENTLLMLATSDCLKVVVKKLLRYNFNLDHINYKNLSAIDIAWKFYTNKNNNKNRMKRYNEIILLLLQEHSKLPSTQVGFELSKASKEVQTFVRMCEVPKYVDDPYMSVIMPNC